MFKTNLNSIFLGTHEELLNADGIYRALCETQILKDNNWQNIFLFDWMTFLYIYPFLQFVKIYLYSLFFDFNFIDPLFNWI